MLSFEYVTKYQFRIEKINISANIPGKISFSDPRIFNFQGQTQDPKSFRYSQPKYFESTFLKVDYVKYDMFGQI